MAAELVQLGWREWLALPQLGIERMKAKIDTGARTSCLHAFRLEPYTHQGEDWLKIWLHPKQKDAQWVHECHAPILDQRQVTDSGGHQELRYVIATEVHLGEQRFQAEFTLTNRDTMKFRMLLGREALKYRYLVNPQASYLQGDPR